MAAACVYSTMTRPRGQGPGPDDPAILRRRILRCSSSGGRQDHRTSRPKRTSRRTRATGPGISRPAFGSTSWRASPIFRRSILGLELTGAKRQNPISFRPVFKATLRNLVEWIETGKEPPDFDGTSRAGSTAKASSTSRRTPTATWRAACASRTCPRCCRTASKPGRRSGSTGALDPDYKGHRQLLRLDRWQLRTVLGRGAQGALSEPGNLCRAGGRSRGGIARRPVHPRGGL